MRRRTFFLLLFGVLLVNLVLDYFIYVQGTSSNFSDYIVATNFIDLGLLVGLFIYFAHDQRSNARTQAALMKALAHLNEVNESLKAAEAERSVFFKKTVHDLKNPLGSIRGFAELLNYDPKDTRSIAQMSQTIQRISDGTLAMVNSLLAPERQLRDSVTGYKELDLSGCVAETCRYLEPLARSKDQRVICTEPLEPVYIRGDALMMRDVFFNLVGNAIKFSPYGATTQVRFSGREGWVSVIVEDEGPGLSNEDLGKLYQPGQKLSARATGGEASSGFGLYSVKETVESHGGKLEAFNNNGSRGASFVVRLPQLEKPLAVFSPPKSNTAPNSNLGSSEPTT